MALSLLLLIFALLLPDGNILRIVFGLPFLLFLPGYALVSVLWVKNSELDGLERTALSLGLSIALVALSGLALNYTPFGITFYSVLFTLFFLIMALTGLSIFRRHAVPAEQRFRLNFDIVFNSYSVLSQGDKILVMLVVVACVIGGSLLVFIASNPPQERFTELYILDGNQTTEDYPTDILVNQNASIIIVCISHEGKAVNYTASVWLHPEAGSKENLAQFNFILPDDRKWQENFNFSINRTGKFKLEIELFKGTGEAPYATNHLWIDVRN